MCGPENRAIKIMKDSGIDIVATLPCEKIRNLLDLVHSDPAFHPISLNKEEDGIGLCAGASLAGGKPAIVIQSSGLGNCFNALLSLSVTYELPLPIIASWRGIYKEEIPAQIPFNKNLPKALEAWNIPYRIIGDASEMDLLEDVILRAYEDNTPSAALISPKTWEGGKAEVEERTLPGRGRKSILKYERTLREPEMRRYDAIEIIAKYLDGEAVVSNIGIPSKELYDIRDRDLNFYMLGSYTQASSIGLGISLKTRRETIVLDGDGSLLGSSILPVVGAEEPKNLSIVCLDNGTLGSTGDQPTSAYSQVDMELVAICANIKETKKVQTEKELRSAFEKLYENEGPRFIHVIIKPGNAEVKEIPLAPVKIKERFKKALGK